MEMIVQNLQETGPVARAQNGAFHPETEVDRDEVRNQLQRILLSPAFQNSKRYAAVFKYIVDQTLNGFGDQLKERTIGIEVFNRPPDYDTSTDHAVRSAMAEIRKRLAQYYQSDANVELRIEVVPGSYTPQFRRAEEERTYASPLSAPVHISPAVQPPAGEPQHRRAWTWAKWAVAAGVILAACVGALVMTERTRGPFEDFWNPVFSSHAPVLFCIGNLEGGKRPPNINPVVSPTSSLKDFHNSASEMVNVHDAFVLAKLAGLLQANGRQFQFASQSDATFADLQRGPTILIGLLNNVWTERLLSNLRFTVDQPTPDKVTIRDRNNPANNDWSIDYGTPYLNVTRDYALVLRVVDPKTEQIVVAAAGITLFGTTAAGDFLSSPQELRKLNAIAPPGWQKKNMEIVLSTDVIRGSSGPPRIVAAQFW
jgi:hypothetical protein